MIIQTRIFREIGLISEERTDWGLEIIFADIQVLVHSWLLALLGLTDTRLQLGHQGVLQEVAQDGAGVQAVDHGVLQAGLGLTLEGAEGWLAGVAREEQGPGQGLRLPGYLAWKIFQSVLLKNISVLLRENILYNSSNL